MNGSLCSLLYYNIPSISGYDNDANNDCNYNIDIHSKGCAFCCYTNVEQSYDEVKS